MPVPNLNRDFRKCNDGPDRCDAGFGDLASTARRRRRSPRDSDPSDRAARVPPRKATPAPKHVGAPFDAIRRDLPCDLPDVLTALDTADRGAAAEQERPSGLLTIPRRYG